MYRMCVFTQPKSMGVSLRMQTVNGGEELKDLSVQTQEKGFMIHQIRDVEYGMREFYGSGARRESPDKDLQVGYQTAILVRIGSDNC